MEPLPLPQTGDCPLPHMITERLSPISCFAYSHSHEYLLWRSCRQAQTLFVSASPRDLYSHASPHSGLYLLMRILPRVFIPVSMVSLFFLCSIQVSQCLCLFYSWKFQVSFFLTNSAGFRKSYDFVDFQLFFALRLGPTLLLNESQAEARNP